MSSSWLLVQGLFAAVAWGFSARSVVRSSRSAGSVQPALADALHEIAQRPTAEGDLARFAQALGGPVQTLLDGPSTEADPEQWALRAQRAYGLEQTPVRALRGLATMGTTLGLLAAVATLRAGLEAPNSDAVRSVATAAFDSAVLGFVTALPCWSALAASRLYDRRTWQGLDRAVVALAGGALSSDAELGQVATGLPEGRRDVDANEARG